ncbi:polynucleotide 3'-phosphatase ZDP isoform X2 [Canna indica]|uniref:Polynucleotide 3'-phosphatase ZDP isoform X2 n=1 Tax=Canna indica TaxID=4628 RepID=A0AAQ3JVE4_9LILI|nr:polynucleotide 3'-phosphatase ZDP isoform X2 [Canna indica]
MLLRFSTVSHSEALVVVRSCHGSRQRMAPAKVVAEYAKSGRSSCKGCTKAISARCLRLGSSSKDPRGFDLVRWFHVDCFPAASRSDLAADEIVGFSSLKDLDKDALRKLVASASPEHISGEVHKRCGDPYTKIEGKSSKKPKVCGTDEAENEDLVEQKACSELSKDDKESCPKMDFHISETKDKYKDATLPPKWKAFRTVIFREKEDGLHDSEKIAAFDFDGCLANTSVKRTGPDAWSLMYQSIPEKLQGLYNKGYKLVIFTNESNIERWKNKRQQAVDSKIGRLENFIKCVKVPIQVFIACGLGKNKDQIDDHFRKPQAGMWRLMEEHLNSGIAIDMDQSFYVGDAAGRINDHSDADIGFAKAVGLKFHLPEELFDA